MAANIARCSRGSSCKCMTNWCSRSPTRLSRPLVGQIRTHMITGRRLAVPLKVDVGVGRNWDEAH